MKLIFIQGLLKYHGRGKKDNSTFVWMTSTNKSYMFEVQRWTIMSPDLTVTIWPGSRWMPFIWAMKMAATASYRAVPSMLMVAPTGSTKRVTLLSIPKFSSRQRKVTGSVPALEGKAEEGKLYFVSTVYRITRNNYSFIFTLTWRLSPGQWSRPGRCPGRRCRGFSWR